MMNKKSHKWRAGRDVLAGVSVSGTSQSVVSSLTICSCALDTKPCDGRSYEHGGRRGRRKGNTHRVVSEPPCARVPAHLRRLEGLALCHPLERLPRDEELAVIQILCRALLGYADRRQFRGQQIQEQARHVDPPAGCSQHE